VNTSLRVVALDLSNKASAIAATHDSTGRPRLAVHTISGTGSLPTHAQIDAIEMGVRRACGYGTGGIALGSGEPDLVAIEGTFSRPGGSDYPLHALHGNVRQWLHRRGIPYVLVAPKTLKVWATGSGEATKRQVVEKVIAMYGRLLNINPADDNQADAVALLSMTLAAYGSPSSTPRCPVSVR
jgi:crossover junction endodeoxyribonuclease RuvC